jgi:acyl carrier protein
MTTISISDQVISCISEALDISPDKLSPNFRKTDIQEWDSLGHLKILLNLEQKFNIKFSLPETMTLDSIKKITELINQKRNT